MPSTPWLRPHFSNLKPRIEHYEDTGCEVADSCLDCPLPRCKYDDMAWYAKHRRMASDFRIVQAIEEEKPVGSAGSGQVRHHYAHGVSHLAALPAGGAGAVGHGNGGILPLGGLIDAPAGSARSRAPASHGCPG